MNEQRSMGYDEDALQVIRVHDWYEVRDDQGYILGVGDTPSEALLDRGSMDIEGYTKNYRERFPYFISTGEEYDD